jgi:kynureninase
LEDSSLTIQFAAASQIEKHNLPPSSLVLLPSDPAAFSTASITEALTAHAASTALVLLPGVQYYTGQLLDIATITAHARSLDLLIIWDLAHAVGNVPLALHDWGVDAAVWCSYKYLNAGPGAIGGLYLHSRRAAVGQRTQGFADRLAGWWGSSKAVRFGMSSPFVALPGARALQLSNPSMADMSMLLASLEVFALAAPDAARSGRYPTRAAMAALHAKSTALFGYAAGLAAQLAATSGAVTLLTPTAPGAHGAQLSLRLADPAALSRVVAGLLARGVVVDERMPDVIRLAPAPLYNTFLDVWTAFEAVRRVVTYVTDA